jgi:excisionase family DNA binding protein
VTALAVDADLHLLTYADAAHLAGVGEGTVRRWVSEGRLAAYREGRSVWVPERELLELEHALRTAPPARRGRPRKVS